MTRGALLAIAIAVAVVGAAAREAAADPTFDDVARGATRLTRLDELVWAVTAPCDAGDALQQRQCRQLRDRRAAQLAAAPLRIDAEPAALEIGAWDAARKSVAIRLVACVRCAGIDVGGRRWRVVGAMTRGQPATLHDTARVFPDAKAAEAWRALLGRARVELIVALPARPRPAGAATLAVDIIGWRIIDPCDGAIVAASPSSAAVAPDKAACAAPAVR